MELAGIQDSNIIDDLMMMEFRLLYSVIGCSILNHTFCINSIRFERATYE